MQPFVEKRPYFFKFQTAVALDTLARVEDPEDTDLACTFNYCCIDRYTCSVIIYMESTSTFMYKGHSEYDTCCRYM